MPRLREKKPLQNSMIALARAELRCQTSSCAEVARVNIEVNSHIDEADLREADLEQLAGLAQGLLGAKCEVQSFIWRTKTVMSKPFFNAIQQNPRHHKMERLTIRNQNSSIVTHWETGMAVAGAGGGAASAERKTPRTSEWITQLRSSLDFLTSLTVLDLSNNNLKDQFAVFKGLPFWTTVTDLRLENNNIDTGTFMQAVGKDLMACARANMQLRCLSLAHNNIKLNIDLVELLATMTAMTDLRLTDNLLEETSHSRSLGAALRCMTGLTTLHLDKNRLQSYGARRLAPALATLTKLDDLRIQGNNLSFVGAGIIAKAVTIDDHHPREMELMTSEEYDICLEAESCQVLPMEPEADHGGHMRSYLTRELTCYAPDDLSNVPRDCWGPQRLEKCFDSPRTAKDIAFRKELEELRASLYRKDIELKFFDSITYTYPNLKYEVLSCTLVDAPAVRAVFEAKMATLATVTDNPTQLRRRTAYHTSHNATDSVCMTGLRPSQCSRCLQGTPCVDPGWFGDHTAGVYVSKHADYTFFYQAGGAGGGRAPVAGDTGRVIVFEVVIGRCYHMAHAVPGCAFEQGYDSHESPNHLEYFLRPDMTVPIAVIEWRAVKARCGIPHDQ